MSTLRLAAIVTAALFVLPPVLAAIPPEVAGDMARALPWNHLQPLLVVLVLLLLWGRWRSKRSAARGGRRAGR